ncbi:MAG: hypothetical protein EOL95_06405 [Bacteroidia bacterium]|nr:hypothetical protein [Bacteroidia bacterium]
MGNFQFHRYILFGLVVALSNSVYGQTVTYVFKQATVVSCLQEIKKQTSFSIIYKPADLRDKEKISIAIKAEKLETVLKRILLPLGLPYKILNKTIIIGTSALLNAQHIEEKQPLLQDTLLSKSLTKTKEELPLEPIITWKDSVVVSYHTYFVTDTIRVDTIFSQKCDTTTIPSLFQRKSVGHYYGFDVCTGYGSLFLPIEGTRPSGGLYVGLNARYVYFFHPRWGISSGVGVSHYNASYSLNYTHIDYHVQDSEGEFYDHITEVVGREEQRTLLALDIPLGCEFRYQVSDRVSLWGGIGAMMEVPLMTSYIVTDGIVRTKGYYPQWGLTLYDLPGRFGTSAISGEKGSFSQPISVAGYANMGVLLDIASHTEIKCTIHTGVSNQHFSIGLQFGIVYQMGNFKPTQKVKCYTHFDKLYYNTLEKEMIEEQKTTIKVPIITYP